MLRWRVTVIISIKKHPEQKKHVLMYVLHTITLYDEINQNEDKTYSEFMFNNAKCVKYIADYTAT